MTSLLSPLLLGRLSHLLTDDEQTDEQADHVGMYLETDEETYKERLDRYLRENVSKCSFCSRYFFLPYSFTHVSAHLLICPIACLSY